MMSDRNFSPGDHSSEGCARLHLHRVQCLGEVSKQVAVVPPKVAYRNRNRAHQTLLSCSWRSNASALSHVVDLMAEAIYLLLTKSFEERCLVDSYSRHLGAT